MKRNDDLLIDKMLEAIGKAAYDSGKVLDPSAWWPLNYLMYRSLFFSDYYRELHEDYKEARKKFPLKTIAKAFNYPTAIWLVLVSLPLGLKIVGVKKKERVRVTLDFLEMLHMRMAGNVFCEDERNIIWDEKKVMKTVKQMPWIHVKKSKFVANYQRLHADLISLNEAVYRNANCATREIHGPYEVVFKSEKTQLIIREFYNFNATDLESALDHIFCHRNTS